MKNVKPLVYLLCATLAGPSGLMAQDIVVPQQLPERLGSGVLSPFEARNVPPITLANSNRLENLLRAGKLYLSLQDAIALAVENNLDIAVQRYGPSIAEQDLRRAQSGGLLRGVPQSVTQGPSSVGQGVSNGGLGNSFAATNAIASTNTNGVITQLGPTTPNLDPTFAGAVSWGHITSPQTSTFVTGTNSLISNRTGANFQLSKGFVYGTNAALTYSNSWLYQNSYNNQINPSIASAVDLYVSQHLLQGFGPALNGRQIRIAKNSLKISDYTFEQQVINIVSSVVNLYWDLVSYNEQAKVARQSLDLAEQSYRDNKRQAEIGTVAEIDLERFAAEIASRQQDLTIAETNVLQQETTLKLAISRTGISSPSLEAARIVPTDHIELPSVEPVQPLGDLVQRALAQRPDVMQSRLNIENSKISLTGSKNALLPTLDAFVELTNNATAGEVNSLVAPPIYNPATGQFVSVGGRANPDPFLVGGYGTILRQIFGRNFPNYTAGLQFNIPLRNRAAQSDYVRDQLTLRQSELQYQKALNQVRGDVFNAVIGVQQARARYDSAVKQRVLQEHTLDAEQKRYTLGASTVFLVVQAQRDVANARANEVQAVSNYNRARVQLEVAMGDLLKAHDVNISEAKRGVVTRQASVLPVLEQQGNGK